MRGTEAEFFAGIDRISGIEDTSASEGLTRSRGDRGEAKLGGIVRGGVDFRFFPVFSGFGREVRAAKEHAAKERSAEVAETSPNFRKPPRRATF
jgi:hypothetical protein